MEKELLIHGERLALVINPAAVIADVGAPDKLDLVLAWTTGGGAGARVGFHHTPGLACMRPVPSACERWHCSLLFPTCVLISMYQTYRQANSRSCSTIRCPWRTASNRNRERNDHFCRSPAVLLNMTAGWQDGRGPRGASDPQLP